VGIELVRPVSLPSVVWLCAGREAKRRSRSHSRSPPSRWPCCWGRDAAACHRLAAAALYLLSLVLAYAIMVLIGLAIGLASFLDDRDLWLRDDLPPGQRVFLVVC